MYPINNLLKEKVRFEWSKECQFAFDKVKRMMTDDTFLVHFDPKLPLILATDASPYGVGAVLSHRYPDGTEKMVMCASQTLNETQQRYSQIDKEAYAIIFGVKKFYQYIYGRQFVLMIDNKPLAQILNPFKEISKLAASSMRHYSVYLMAFDFKVEFRKTEEHCNADGFSRLPEIQQSKFVYDEIDVLEINQINVLPVMAEDIKRETLKTYHKLLKGLQMGKGVEAKDRFNIDQNEFSIQNGCIFRGCRVLVPSSLRGTILRELHSSHFGMTRMKELARSYCWWKNIDKDIEEIVKSCEPCQRWKSNPKKAPIHCWEEAKNPFDRVHVDYAGPFQGKMFFLLVDSFTKWLEVIVVSNSTTESTIKSCRGIFSTFGIPSILVSDHGAQFMSEDFQIFLKNNGIAHKCGAPYHPATNGQVERYVQMVKQKLKCLEEEKGDIHLKVCQILMDYRRLVHPATGLSPAMSMFGRQIRSKLDLLKFVPEKPQVQHDFNKKFRSFKVGDRVSVREYIKVNRKWEFGSITKKLGKYHYLVKLDDGRIWKRHIDQMRTIGDNIKNSGKTRSYNWSYDGSQEQNDSGNEKSSENTITIQEEVPETIQPLENEGSELLPSLVEQQDLVAVGDPTGNGLQDPVVNAEGLRRSQRIRDRLFNLF